MPPCPPAEGPHEQSVAYPTASSPRFGGGAVIGHRADTLFLQAPGSRRSPHPAPTDHRPHGLQSPLPRAVLTEQTPWLGHQPVRARPVPASRHSRPSTPPSKGRPGLPRGHPNGARSRHRDAPAGGLRGVQSPVGDTFGHQTLCVLAAPGPPWPGEPSAQHWLSGSY